MKIPMNSNLRDPSVSRIRNSVLAFYVRYQWQILLVASSLLLTAFTVYEQVFRRVGLTYIWDEQLRFHRGVIEGITFDPWQYRILAPYLIQAAHAIVKYLGFTPSYGRLFFALRIIQNFLIFIVMGIYLRKLSLKRSFIYIVLVVLAWGFTYSGYASGLAFDTYFDILFYLLAASFTVSKHYAWIIPLSALAAINRETGILIPLLPLISTVQFRPRLQFHRRTTLMSLASLCLFIVLMLGVRAWYGPRSYYHLFIPGLDLLRYNLTNFNTYYSAISTYSLVPFIAILNWKYWPNLLRRLFWLLVPIWLIIHSFTSHMAEARLFLVPYVLIFLPAAFLAMDRSKESL
jgi:hypothetical protein